MNDPVDNPNASPSESSYGSVRIMILSLLAMSVVIVVSFFSPRYILKGRMLILISVGIVGCAFLLQLIYQIIFRGKYIFIAYNSAYKEQAFSLKRELETYTGLFKPGVSMTDESDINPNDLNNLIIKRLKKASLVIAIPGDSKSYLDAEIMTAYSHRKKVIYVKVSDTQVFPDTGNDDDLQLPYDFVMNLAFQSMISIQYGNIFMRMFINAFSSYSFPIECDSEIIVTVTYLLISLSAVIAGQMIFWKDFSVLLVLVSFFTSIILIIPINTLLWTIMDLVGINKFFNYSQWKNEVNEKLIKRNSN